VAKKKPRKPGQWGRHAHDEFENGWIRAGEEVGGTKSDTTPKKQEETPKELRRIGKKAEKTAKRKRMEKGCLHKGNPSCVTYLSQGRRSTKNEKSMALNKGNAKRRV